MKKSISSLLVIVTISCFASFSSDIYAPSVPAIAHYFAVNVSMVQWSLSLYLIGLAGSHLFYGPLSEHYGRKRLLLLGLAIACVGGLMTVCAANIEGLLLGRFIQGCGAGACATLWRAIFRDLYAGEELARYSSYLVVFVIVIVPGAPLLGGYLEQAFGWRASFLVMLGYVILALLAITCFFTESKTADQRQPASLAVVRQSFGELLRSRLFVGITLCTFLCYGAFFAWFSVGPVLLIEHLHLTPATFGWVSAIGGVASYGLSALLNARFVGRFGVARMMRAGFVLMLIASVSMLLLWQLLGPGLWPICLPIFLFYFGANFIWPNAFASAFSPFGHIAGYAASLYGFMQLGGGAVISGVLGLLPKDSAIPLAATMLVCVSLAWLAYEAASARR